MERCHGYHMKIYPNKVKVTVTFTEDEMYLVQYLSKQYTQGCLAEFSHDLVMRSIKDNFTDDIKAIHTLKPNATAASPTDLKGTSSQEE